MLAGSVVDHTASQGKLAMRETIRLTGRLEPEDLTQMREEFTNLYRRWRSEQQ